MPSRQRLIVIFILLSVASIKGQISKPEDIKPLSIPPWPEVKDGKIEETFGGRVNITWEDGSQYSVRKHNVLF